jgi:uncharacterized protein (TIGR00255 family)
VIRSMTGFGDASAQVDGAHYVVELRSLNNRYFKVSFRLPEEFSSLESDLEMALRKHLSRGSITVVVKTRLPEGATHRVNDTALLTYLGHLETIQDKVAQRAQSMHIDLTALLALPGVLQQLEDDESVLSRARPVLLGLLSEACQKLDAMRMVEGKQLAEDLGRHQDVIRDRLAVIGSRAGEVVEVYHQRLRSRINELMSRAQLSVSEPDLIRELAVFAERADISEELSRLSGHLEQFEQIIGSTGGDPAGRTLDFVAQELLREANTIASKSNDVQISRAIVEIKGAIDRIKEQVQNVE